MTIFYFWEMNNLNNLKTNENYSEQTVNKLAEFFCELIRKNPHLLDDKPKEPP